MMSTTDSKQAQAVNFVLGKQPLNGRSAFSAITPSAPFSAHLSDSGTLKAHMAAGNKQMAQQVIIYEKARLATDLVDRQFLYSVVDLTHSAQTAMAIARSIQDEELMAFMEDYVRQGLNYLTNTHAGYLETLRVKLDELIQRGVEPTFVDKLRAFFGLM